LVLDKALDCIRKDLAFLKVLVIIKNQLENFITDLKQEEQRQPARLLVANSVHQRIRLNLNQAGDCLASEEEFEWIIYSPATGRPVHFTYLGRFFGIPGSDSPDFCLHFQGYGQESLLLFQLNSYALSKEAKKKRTKDLVDNLIKCNNMLFGNEWPLSGECLAKLLLRFVYDSLHALENADATFLAELRTRKNQPPIMIIMLAQIFQQHQLQFSNRAQLDQ
jgi:hypothetical protein